MGIDYLILIWLLKMRHSFAWVFEPSESDEYVIKSYDDIISESIVCDAPQETYQQRPRLHLVK